MTVSDPDAKASRSKAKDARQSPAPEKPSTGSKRRVVTRPWRLENLGIWGYKYGKYKSREVALVVAKQQIRRMTRYPSKLYKGLALISPDGEKEILWDNDKPTTQPPG